MAEQATALKVGYVVKMFPRLSETFVLNEMLELESQGVEITVFSVKKPNEGRFHPQVSSLKARVLYLEDLDSKKWAGWLSREWPTLAPNARHIWKLLNDALESSDTALVEKIWFSAWVAAQAAKLGLDRLHAHFASLPSTIAYLAHRIIGIPYSFTAHAKDIFVYSLDEHYLRDKLVTASPVVTVTNYNYRYLTGKLPESAGHIEVIHNGIDVESFRTEKNAAREKNLILSVGRLVPKKGLDTLLQACKLLKERGTPFHCRIVGTGPQEEALKEQRLALGLQDEVTFSGAQTIDEVLSLMKTATLFCLPCRMAEDGNMDALPTVLLEALACGLPIISTSVSGIPEIVDHGKDGILVEPDDPEALAAELTRLLRSRELQTEFANAGRETAEDKFDLRKNVGRLLSVFHKYGLDHSTTMDSGSAADTSEVRRR